MDIQDRVKWLFREQDEDEGDEMPVIVISCDNRQQAVEECKGLFEYAPSFTYEIQDRDDKMVHVVMIPMYEENAGGKDVCMTNAFTDWCHRGIFVFEGRVDASLQHTEVFALAPTKEYMKGHRKLMEFGDDLSLYRFDEVTSWDIATCGRDTPRDMRTGCTWQEYLDFVVVEVLGK